MQDVLELSFCKLFWIWVLKFIASQVSKTHTAGGSLKLKVIMVVHFVRGCKIEMTPLPNIASCQADGWVNYQFSQMIKKIQKQIVYFVIIVRGVQGAVFVNDLLEMWGFRLADHWTPDWLFSPSSTLASQSSAMMLISFSSLQWLLPGVLVGPSLIKS